MTPRRAPRARAPAPRARAQKRAGPQRSLADQERSEQRSRAGPVVGIIMGSASDRPIMNAAVETLTELGISYEVRIVSAHRAPDWTFEYASSAERRGIKIIIAGAGGAAHLPGVTAAKTVVPVIGVPVPSEHLKGLDSLLSMVQMPGGVPVAISAIGKAGAVNAALLAARILGVSDQVVRARVERHQRALAAKVREADRAEAITSEST